jgi:hypothetical protein
MNLVPERCTTAFDDDVGLYIQSLEGMAIISGPPVETMYLDLADDPPAWRIMDPRAVEFQVRSILRLHPRLRHPLDIDPFATTAEIEDATNVPEPRTVRHFRWLRRTLGPKRVRWLQRLSPEAPSPYLLIWLAQRIPAFDDLLMQSPMLAVLIALDRSNGRLALDDYVLAVREESALPRREILAARGLPPAAVRGFARIMPAAADLTHIADLRLTLQEPAILKQWNHLERIGPSTIQILGNPRLFQCVSGRFLAELVRREPFVEPGYHADCLRKFNVFRGIETGGRRRHRFDSLPALEAWHDELGDGIDPEEALALCGIEFPRAPFEGEPDCIEQILTGRELLAESFAMKHCVAGSDYVDAMLSGESFIFRAGGWGLERCTIEVQCRSEDELDEEGGSRYIIAEVRGRRNESISYRTLAALRIWAEMQGLAVAPASELPI